MGKKERTLMSYTPEIKVMDCTLRDGGLVNDFFFSDEFVKDLYEANLKSGVDYMEFGYKASKEMFDVKKFGKWKFCDDKDIRAVVGDNKTDFCDGGCGTLRFQERHSQQKGQSDRFDQGRYLYQYDSGGSRDDRRLHEKRV